MEFFTPGHLIPLLIVAAILFFGWKQLPDMARSVGRSLRIFKTEIKGMSEDDKTREAAKTTPAVTATTATTPAAAPVSDPVVVTPVVTPVDQEPVTTPPNGTKPADGT